MNQQSPEKQLGYIEKKLDKVLMYLFGDEENKQNIGALAEIADMKKRIDKLEKFNIKLWAVIVTLAFIAGIGMGNILDLFKH